ARAGPGWPVPAPGTGAAAARVCGGRRGRRAVHRGASSARARRRATRSTPNEVAWAARLPGRDVRRRVTARNSGAPGTKPTAALGGGGARAQDPWPGNRDHAEPVPRWWRRRCRASGATAVNGAELGADGGGSADAADGRRQLEGVRAA